MGYHIYSFYDQSIPLPSLSYTVVWIPTLPRGTGYINRYTGWVTHGHIAARGVYRGGQRPGVKGQPFKPGTPPIPTPSPHMCSPESGLYKNTHPTEVVLNFIKFVDFLVKITFPCSALLMIEGDLSGDFFLNI